MISPKEQAQAIATFKDEELNKEVLNNSVEITLQKLQKNGLSAEQEDFIIESQLELIRERREEDI